MKHKWICWKLIFAMVCSRPMAYLKYSVFIPCEKTQKLRYPVSNILCWWLFLLLDSRLTCYGLHRNMSRDRNQNNKLGYYFNFLQMYSLNKRSNQNICLLGSMSVWYLVYYLKHTRKYSNDLFITSGQVCVLKMHAQDIWAIHNELFFY